MFALPSNYYYSTGDILGTVGDPIGDSLELGMIGGDGLYVTNARGIAEPMPPAQECFYYEDRTVASGRTAGVYCDHSGARTVALAFPFETINTGADRQEVLRRCVNFLGVRTAAGINGLKAYANGEWVVASGKIVTAVFDGFFYIQDPDRTSGIKVITGESVAVGDLANVEGPLGTADRERHIQAGRVQNLGAATLARPLGMSNALLGGSDLVPGQSGVTGGLGLNNIGLLVRTWGRVVSASADSFSISDGSGVEVRVAVPVGLAIPSEGSYVAVTGISSCGVEGEETIRLVRMREEATVF